MMRNRKIKAVALERAAAMKTWQLMILHALAASTFIFLLQRFSLNASLESSLLWALTFAVCAAGLAYKQTIR